MSPSPQSECYKIEIYRNSLARMVHPDKATIKMNEKVHETVSSHGKQWENQQTAPPDFQTPVCAGCLRSRCPSLQVINNFKVSLSPRRPSQPAQRLKYGIILTLDETLPSWQKNEREQNKTKPPTYCQLKLRARGSFPLP